MKNKEKKNFIKSHSIAGTLSEILPWYNMMKSLLMNRY